MAAASRVVQAEASGVGTTRYPAGLSGQGRTSSCGGAVVGEGERYLAPEACPKSAPR